MNRTHQALQEPRQLVIRDDLEAVLPANLLIRMVYDATGHSGWSRPLLGPLDKTPDIVLRSVVTYCYAVGILGSSDIEAAAMHEPVVHYLCANHWPQWQTVRDFRRRNGPGLKDALANLFHVAALLHGVHLDRNDHRTEADRRLARAVQADSCALDI